MNFLTIKSENEIRPLIAAIENSGQEEVATTAAIALLNLIPYAGGAVASIVGDIASRRRFEKVCDVLSDLNSRLEAHGAEPEKHLSKDQVIEVVHETLQTVTTASDQKKIDALKNGLAYAFIADDRFDRKQLLLQILRGCTSLELAALIELYDCADPYETREPRQPTGNLLNRGLGGEPRLGYDLLGSAESQRPESQGQWVPIGHTSQCGKDPLLVFLSKRIDVDEGATEGALRLLDGKGLANAGPNLSRSDCKVLRWTDTVSPYLTNYGSLHSPTGMQIDFEKRPTPVEASRTKFGQDFLRFCRTT